ncbi:MAG: hypothetical protein KDL31_06800 [Kiritimatiellae bacterium]|nr:hypothetical protein [Kiritimatiellia bacterium]MCB1102915.1 hypothetical protein [Kiritimatiellia bacterium]
MKRPESPRTAIERLAGELERTGESLSDLMRRVKTRLTGGKGASSEMKNTHDLETTFDDALAEALREEMGYGWPAPASRPRGGPDGEPDVDWEAFDRELERDLKKKFKL